MWRMRSRERKGLGLEGVQFWQERLCGNHTRDRASRILSKSCLRGQPGEGSEDKWVLCPLGRAKQLLYCAELQASTRLLRE